ncbi:MAG TPA: hypothetical protein VHG27_04900 [Xanthobacteraceae bacterium]|nr:hypothetical protein [Xanthobacteraceae bacterium]
MMLVRSCVLTAGVLLTGSSSPLVAQTFDSVYTDLNVEQCGHRPGTQPEDHGYWRCNGYAGIPIRVAASDQRMYMSFGRKAADQPAAGQTFPSFNNVYKARIEWRRKKTGDNATPFAAIVRWNVKIDDDDRPSRGRVLVVTRLGERVCHVGYVDALANKDANAVARRLADEHAAHFDCGKDKRIVLGERGESVAGIIEEIEGEAPQKNSAGEK